MDISNLTRYTMVIRRDHEGFATPALKVRQQGEVVKFDDVKELLQTDVQQLKAEIAIVAKVFEDKSSDGEMRDALDKLWQLSAV